MSLRAFHIVFIILSSALAFGGGLWVLWQDRGLVWALGCFAASVCLDIYLVWFVKKAGRLKS